MATGELSGGDALLQSQQAILLTGEGIAALSDQHCHLLRQVASAMAGGFAVEASFTSTIMGYTEGRAEQEPVPAARQDFVDFAVENGFSEQIASLAWCSIRYTGAQQQREHEWGVSLPKLRFVGGTGGEVVDLRSIRERLESSRFTPGPWIHGTQKRVAFLRALVEARIGFDGS